MNPLLLPRKLYGHYERGGIWALVYLLTSKVPRLPLPSRIKWLVARGHEIDFWDRYFKTQGLYWKSGFLSRFDEIRPLDPYVAEVVAHLNGEKIRMLDVGAGPLTSLSRGFPERQIEITAVDPLAREYDRILAKYGHVPPIRTQYGEAEKLQAIRQMVKLTRPSGYVVLQHVPNEATNEKWLGFHQWNFLKERNEFLIKGKSITFNVNRELGTSASLTTELNDKANWLVVKIKKLN
jgi:hypothetical protein